MNSYTMYDDHVCTVIVRYTATTTVLLKVISIQNSEYSTGITIRIFNTVLYCADTVLSVFNTYLLKLLLYRYLSTDINNNINNNVIFEYCTA